jgi:hypothetical protein
LRRLSVFWEDFKEYAFFSITEFIPQGGFDFQPSASCRGLPVRLRAPRRTPKHARQSRVYEKSQHGVALKKVNVTLNARGL